MKNIYLSTLLSLCVLTFNTCSLDKDIAIPTGATIAQEPVLSNAAFSISGPESVYAKILFQSTNLKVLKVGCVWSENPNPTIADSKMELQDLSAGSYVGTIDKLTSGKTYYFRPYAITGSGIVTYGADSKLFMNLLKAYDIVVMSQPVDGFECSLRVQSTISPVPLTEYGLIYLEGVGQTPTLQNNGGKLEGKDLTNGKFNTLFNMLPPNTKYSIRTYAINLADSSYSNVKEVTTPNSSLEARFGISTSTVIFQGAEVQFYNNSSQVSPEPDFVWNFGDGQSSIAKNPKHIFNMVGTFVVRLTAFFSGHCGNIKEIVIKVEPNAFKDYWKDMPAGTFSMGCTPEQGRYCPDNVHQVTLSNFKMGKTEITVALWKAVMGNLDNIDPSLNTQCGIDCPIGGVSWELITDIFIPTLNRKTGKKNRLPTEAEWEYAARGGLTGAAMTTYSGSNVMDEVGWWERNSDYKIQPVAQKKANGYGLYDMSGNVSEWCSDWYGNYPADAQTNPRGPNSGSSHVNRGGDVIYLSHDERYILWLQTGYRRAMDIPNYATGFRLVQE